MRVARLLKDNGMCAGAFCIVTTPSLNPLENQSDASRPASDVFARRADNRKAACTEASTHPHNSM